MGLTLISMLSKTKIVFTTHLPVLCSVASSRSILSITWRIE
nr:MAG TPA: AAA ATPase [Caudoviricetes sp.]DAZ38739.1 MAG TPA: AAA ATPase [Caudoviricetes sp.]